MVMVVVRKLGIVGIYLLELIGAVYFLGIQAGGCCSKPTVVEVYSHSPRRRTGTVQQREDPQRLLLRALLTSTIVSLSPEDFSDENIQKTYELIGSNKRVQAIIEERFGSTILQEEETDSDEQAEDEEGIFTPGYMGPCGEIIEKK